MTVQEASKTCFGKPYVVDVEEHEEAIKTIKEALEEVEQYRALGTVEEIKKKIQTELPYMSLAQARFKSELDEYRNIGTVEELKEAKMKVSVYEQIKWERDIAISQLEEIGISLGQKMDDIKEAREKQVAKKPTQKEFEKKVGWFNCSICGRVIEKQNYCQNCGQALDWSDEE